MSIVAKICTDCGIDVSGQKRTKDTAGRYYCQPCWSAKVRTGAASPRAPEYGPPSVRPVQVLPYRNPQPAQPVRASGSSGSPVAQMAIGAAICTLGIVVTAGTYMAAVAGGGGRYTVAWGAIVFGGWRFFKGLGGVIGNR